MDLRIVDTFWLLSIMLLWTLAHKIFLCEPVFISRWHIPGCEIAGSYGDSMFKLLRKCQAVLQNDHITFQSYQEWVRARFLHILTYPCHCLFNTVSLVGGKGYLPFVCIFFMTNGTEKIFMWLLTVCMSSLEIHVFVKVSRSFARL